MFRIFDERPYTRKHSFSRCLRLGVEIFGLALASGVPLCFAALSGERADMFACGLGLIFAGWVLGFIGLFTFFHRFLRYQAYLSHPLALSYTWRGNKLVLTQRPKTKHIGVGLGAMTVLLAFLTLLLYVWHERITIARTTPCPS